MSKNINIGSRVSPVDENLKGEVIAINGTKITIEDEDGFERVYESDKLVVYDTVLVADRSLIMKSSNRNFKKSIKKNANVIDLHISNTYLNPNQILDSQIELFNLELKKAIQYQKPKITFIHGVGEGILKKRIEKILRNKNIQFSEAAYHTYGQGAIDVFLK